MPLQVDPKPLIVILGPTAVGKTEISIELAERLDGEIISADSRLFYRGMDIGTAKPSPVEQLQVPHHLIDVVDPNESWSLATFQQAAYKVIDDIHHRGRLPFLVGGTGQYVKAVIEGWDIPEVEPNPGLRAALVKWAEQVSPLGLHDRLKELDPDAAGRIDPPNLRRTVRALEVILHTGRLFSSQHGKMDARYKTLLLGINRPRPALYERIDARIQTMLDSGLVGEVRSLLAAGYSPDLPAFSAIGYRQIISYIKGEISLEEAIVLMKRHTRQFVRRQANWFKLEDPDIFWFQAGPEATNEMGKTILAFLDS
jgi:tRNA dimethylallyltransferase